MHGKAELRLPPLYGAHSAAEIASDFLPRIQYLAFDHFGLPFTVTAETWPA